MSNSNSIFYLPFEKKVQLSPDAWTFYFRRNGSEPNFSPGQYFELKLDISDCDERGNTRVFTMSSSPTNKDFFIITTRIIQSSFKMKLLNLDPETKVQFDGPWDDLDINLSNPSSKVFLAGGIGVTPFHSTVEYCRDMNLDVPIVLFSSWSNKSEVLFDNFFRLQEKHLPHFTYVPTITGREDLEGWNGERSRIDQSVIERYVVNPSEATYYIVGPGGFVKGMEEVLSEMKIPHEKIVPEHFSGY